MPDTGRETSRILVVSRERGSGRDIADRLARVGYAPLDLIEFDEEALEAILRLSPNLVVMAAAPHGETAALQAGASVRERCGIPVLLAVTRLDRDLLDRVAKAGLRGCLPAEAEDDALLASLDMALRAPGNGSGEQALRRSLDQLNLTLEQTVNALAVTSEKRDPFTAGHQQRVSWLAEAIARELGLSEECQKGVRMAGLVHDIGKIHVPSEILAKTEMLSPLEMDIVRGHSEVGHEILKDVPFPWPVARMVLEHHERLDGSGYPAGLVGSAILPESRILAVADVVEAMTAHRPYRTAYSMDRALEEIRGKRGVLYDPEVVDACLLLCGDGGCFKESRIIP